LLPIRPKAVGQETFNLVLASGNRGAPDWAGA
jgi:hypothetical protein